jgi:radical SAM superfamily enzyme YgiQ (UPF0313 family)
MFDARDRPNDTLTAPTKRSRLRAMRVTLVEPSRYAASGRLLKGQRLLFPMITLPLLAALAPADVRVKIVNEYFDEIDFREPADVVGITSFTSRILRAYEIADEFRRRGVHVVMGGIHVSMEPDEALAHADTVIVGEAEELWPRFIEDFRRGAPRALYRCDAPPSLDRLPAPRFTLLDPHRYLTLQRTGVARLLPLPLIPVQTARGCPHHCDYCSVTSFSGNRYRARPVADVVEEVRALDARGCLFVDDNIFAHPSRAKELFRALTPLKVTWVGQGTLSAAEDPELLRLARASGCVAVLVGMESISAATLTSVGKPFNVVDHYPLQIRRFRDAGIALMASMMFGLDGEPPTVFDETHRFLMEHRVPYALWQPLMPLPGTRLLERFRDQGRLKADRWWLERDLAGDFLKIKFTGLFVPEERFGEMFRRAYARFYSLKHILLRMLWPPQERCLVKVVLSLIFRARIVARASITGS